MKKISYIFLLFLIIVLPLQQVLLAQNPTFRKSFNASLFDIPGGMVQANNGDYVFAGGGTQAVAICINSASVIQWAKRYNSGFVSQFNDIKKVSTGGYILCGGSSSSGAILTKLDVNGNCTWSRKYEFPAGGNANAYAVIETSDGGFLVGGSVSHFYNGTTYVDSSSALGFKVNSTGVLQWSKVWTLTNPIKADEHYINDVAESSDGYFFLGESADETGSYNSNGNLPRNALVIKTDKNGVTRFIRRWGGNTTSQGINAAITLTLGTNAGKILLGGYDDIHAFLVTLNGTGDTPGFSGFNRRINGSTLGYNYLLTDVLENPDGHYAILGTRIAFLAMALNTIIVKLNSSTNAIIFGRDYAPIGLSSLLPEGGIASDGGYFTCQYDQQMTGHNFNLLRTDASGNIGSSSTGCAPTNFTPGTSSYSPSLSTPTSLEYTSMTSSAITTTVSNFTPTEILHCITCVPPDAATTVTATPNPICSGQSTSITASGPSTGVYYNVYTASTGGTNLGTTPVSVSPTSTTTYYVETVSNTDPTCVSTTRTPVTVTVNPQATANAGPNQTICAGSTVTLAGTIGGSATSATWTGGGTFNPNATTLNAVYTPTPAQVTAGTATLTLTTNDPDGPCPAASSTMTITINAQPTVNAGPDQTICAGATVTLAGSYGSTATSATWSGGTGTYNPNNTTMSAVYTPSATEVTAGTVTLTLTTNNPAGPCNAVTDNMVITINAQPTVNAGPDQSICAGTSATLSGTFGSTATSATWSGGTGTFSPNNTTMNATYTPSASEISSGSVSLTLTTNNPAGPCTAQSDNMVITINPQPTANAIATTPICVGSSSTLTASGLSGSTYIWSHGAGNTAIVTVSPSTTTTYTVSVSDANNCGTATAQVTVEVVSEAVVNANPDTICKGTTYPIMANISNYASVLWSTSGTGSFSDATIANPIYTPSNSDNNNGSVVLTVTATGFSPCASATGTINLALVEPLPPLLTNSAIPVCANASTFTLTGTPAGGTFSGTGVANNQFNPATAGAGTHAITYTISDNHGCTNQTTDSITVWPLPFADAGSNQSICEGDSVSLTATGLHGSTFVWSHNLGDSAMVIVAPTVTTTYTVSVTDENNCGTATDNVVVTVVPQPVIIATNDSICAGNTYQTNVNITNYNTINWSSSGNGSFSSTSVLNPVYTPDNSDIASGQVVLTVTANGNSPCSNISTDITLTILPLPNIIFDSLSNICLNQSAILLNTATPSGGTYSGNGVVNNTFNPQSAGAGLHPITYTYTDNFGCTNTSTLPLTVMPLPVVNLLPFDNICVTETEVNIVGGTPQGGYYYGQNINNNIFNPAVAGAGTHNIYYVYQDANGCSDTASTTILVVPEVTLSSDVPDNTIYIDLGAIVNFTATPSNQGTYVFGIDSIDLQTSTSNVFASNTLESQNVVYVILNNACFDTLTIHVKPVPNAFIPFDYDGSNDVFMPYVDLTIVNRWGQELYKGNEGWDGTYNGVNVSPGTYFYLIRLKALAGEDKLITGTVTLIKK